MALEIILNFGLLIASIAALVLIADKLINHSIKLAKIVGVSGTVIGLTLLAYGTSLPELAVSTIASFQSHSELSVSNIIGSNIYNIAITMGVVALFLPFAWKENLRREGLFMVASTLVLIALAFIGGISSMVGIIMVLILALHTYYVIKIEKRSSCEKVKKGKGSAKKEFLWCCLFLAGVLVAGNFTVHYAIQSAKLVGVSEWLIGSTIVAAGTSMPETVVSVIAARKKQMGMSLGNIIGSNYFNVFWILGISAALKPFSFSIQAVWADLVFLSLITALFFMALLKKSISRYEGFAYIGIYVLFVFYLLKILAF